MTQYYELRGTNGEDVWDFKINVKAHTWIIRKNGVEFNWVTSFKMSASINEDTKIVMEVLKTDRFNEPVFRGRCCLF